MPTQYVLNYEPRPEYVESPTYTSLSDLSVTSTFVIKPRVKPKAAIKVEGFFPSSSAEGFAFVNSSALNFVSVAVESKASTAVNYLPAGLEINAIRSYLSVHIDAENPAIINGRPYSPLYWGQYGFSGTANNSGTITVVPKPPPPTPRIVRPGKATYTWEVGDLSTTSSLSKWPEHGNDGPAWYSGNGFNPSVVNRVTFGSHGKETTETKSVLFDYKNIEHMWIDMGINLNDSFTWMFAGLILSYPTARYGHYILDHGSKSARLRRKPTTESGAKILGDSGYRAAMLYQRHSAVMGSHTGNDLVANGKHVRITNNYSLQPRVFYSIWNGGASNNKGRLGTIGHKYYKHASATIDTKTFRNFVIGRRFNKLSTALASHMVLFEIRFFEYELNKTEIFDNYRNLASRYKFREYPR